MLCGVTATLGSNPSATATAARPQWGRAVLLCLDGVRARVLGPGCLVCLARPGCLVCPWAAARPRAVRATSFARRVASKPGQAPPPPTGPAAWPSGTLHTGGACVAVCGWERRLEARPGPAAAHGHRRLALRALRHPPHRRRLCRCVWLGASPRSPARPRRRPRAPQPGPQGPPVPSTPAAPGRCCLVRCVVSKPGQAPPPPTGPQSGRANQAAGCLKPVSPLLVPACVGWKPSSPLRVRNGCFLVQFSGAEVMSVSTVPCRG